MPWVVLNKVSYLLFFFVVVFVVVVFVFFFFVVFFPSVGSIESISEGTSAHVR